MHIQRGLTVRRLRQFFERSIPRDPAQGSSENLVSLLEQFPRRGIMRRQFAPHPDALRSLTGKQ